MSFEEDENGLARPADQGALEAADRALFPGAEAAEQARKTAHAAVEGTEAAPAAGSAADGTTAAGEGGAAAT